MKKINLALLVFVIVLYNVSHANGQGLIIPMPGQSTVKSSNSTHEKSSSYNSNQKETRKSTPSKDSSGAIIPLPNLNSSSSNDKTSYTTTNTSKSKNNQSPKTLTTNSEALITIPIPEKKHEEILATTSNNQSVNLESENSSSSLLDDEFDDFFKKNGFSTSNSSLKEANDPPQKTTSLLDEPITSKPVANPNNGEISVFSKDTGSAIFMVMKTWKCDDYPVQKLVEQALDVYAEEAGEKFEIKGFENVEKSVTVNIEEEDITLDELLDIIATKIGHDWGCDLANKTIYIYPKGIKTDSYVSW